MKNYINTNTLMLGNLIMCKETKSTGSVRRVGSNLVVEIDGKRVFKSKKEFEPIYITHDYLMNLGFIYIGNSNYKLRRFHFNLEMNLLFLGNDHLSSGNYDAKVFHVHVLQNIINLLS